MNRRTFLSQSAITPLALSSSAVLAGAAQGGSQQYHLRYAPRIGWLELPLTRQIELYAQNGFRAFEYNGLPNHSDQEIGELRKKMDQLNMAMGVFVVNRGGWKPVAMPDKGGHKRFLEDVRRGVEIHKIVGNECATVTSGLTVPHLTFAQQTANCVEVLKRAAELVEKTKMVLVLEPLNHKVDHAGYFVVYSEHAAEIIGSVNHPNVRILFDMYHQQISEGNLINHIHQYWDWIGYFQIGDVPGRKEPYTGEVNWQNVFKAIHEKGYKGILGMEHGLSVPGEAGVKKCFDAYRKADSWS